MEKINAFLREVFGMAACRNWN